MGKYDSDDSASSYGGSDSDDFTVTKKKPAPKPKAAPKAKAAPKKKPMQEHNSPGNGDSDVVMDEDDDVADLPSVPKPKAKTKTASETYQKLSQLEHVLKRPDTYIGSVEPITQPMWVFDEETKGLVYRSITFVPGLYKIVDEILVNAADNKVRDSSMSTLKVTIDREAKTISVMNDGSGIPVEMHDEHKCYIPELIFGQLLTSSNYDDEEAKVTGGRNGYGAKLANIYSTEFIVETADSKNGKKYKQVFSNNMGAKGKPKITENKKGEDWTRITFTPDLPRFHMTEFDNDTVSLFQKRVYDMAGITKGVKVYLNDKRITVKNFKAFVEMYTNGVNEVAGTGGKPKAAAAANGDGLDLSLVGAPEAGVPKTSIIYEQFGERWEVAFAVSDNGFQQVSYCNAIATTKGGTHVNYITDQIVNGIVDQVKKKNKAAPVKPFQVKQHLSIFINCLIANPAFDSQTKENMTLGVSKFGSKCVINEEFLKKVIKSGVVDSVLTFAKFKQDQMLKKSDGSKRSRITGLVKLEDANNAGTRNGNKCTLILTEGDSAKALAVSGLSVVGRDNYGVFPLRGKLLNVREASGKTLLENQEIQAIKQIMGLQQGKVYTSTDSLRYGSLMIMADQDHDGSHIKGLIINFLDYWFPSLLTLPNFLLEFITPIVKVSKNKREISFFTIPEYEAWKEETDDGRGWKIKYFKGLGTSDAADAKKYFGDMRRHRLPFQVSTPADRELIDMAFNKKKADNRKEWLRGFVPGTFMDHNVEQVPIADFINKELILFSMADNIRSIPSMVDGFKPGQRKVLFACFKRKLKAEIKVAQLSGYVSEHSAYHHGDVSLQMTIIGLAQNFVGSNNLNLLDPNGQFGTRLQGGKDAASARYVFTNVAQLTRMVFHPADDNVLSYLNDDGQSIEPEWYMPVLPMSLVNGSDGIGTGWSSFVPNYNPSDIVANLRRKMAGEELVPIHPWYRGFRGAIEAVDKDGYKCSGICEQIDDSTVEITELPIRVWTQSYKEMLESWVSGTDKQPAWLKDYKEYHTDTTVHFVCTLTEKGREQLAREGLEKTFKMSTKINTTNMVMFDPHGKIKKYTTPEEVLDDFYDVRLDYYHRRKAHLVSELTNQHDKLSNQARFIKEIIDKRLVLSNRKKAAIVLELREREYRPFPKAAKALVIGGGAADEAGEDAEEEVPDAEGGLDSDFDYLLGMALGSLTAEKVAKLMAERDDKEQELTALLALSAQDLWSADLDVFSTEWEAFVERDGQAQAKGLRAAKAKAAGKGKQKRMKHGSDDSDSDADFVVKKSKSAPKPKPIVAKAPVALPSESDEDKPKSKPAPVPVKKPASPKPAPAPKKKPAAVILSDSDDDDVYSRPAKKPSPKRKASVKSNSDADSEPAVVKKKAKPTPAPAAAKPKPAAAEPAAKPAAKKKSYDDSDNDDDDFEVPSKPAPTTARTARAATTKKKTYALPSSSDEEDAGSDFDDDD